MPGTWQPAALTFPDAEQWTVDYLTARIPDLPDYSGHAAEAWIGSESPDKRWDLMVVVRRDGGSVTGVDDFPRLSVRTWALTEPVATAFAGWVTTQLLAAPGVRGCKAVRHLSGPLRVPDPRTRQRLSFFELTLRGEPA